MSNFSSISGLVVEYIVAIDVTRVRFPADAYIQKLFALFCATLGTKRRGEISEWLCADGSIAQWLERLTADQQVPGSNPGWPFVEYVGGWALRRRPSWSP